jgi:hypothetical protein
MHRNTFAKKMQANKMSDQKHQSAIDPYRDCLAQRDAAFRRSRSQTRHCAVPVIRATSPISCIRKSSAIELEITIPIGLSDAAQSATASFPDSTPAPPRRSAPKEPAQLESYAGEPNHPAWNQMSSPLLQSRISICARAFLDILAYVGQREPHCIHSSMCP